MNEELNEIVIGEKRMSLVFEFAKQHLTSF